MNMTSVLEMLRNNVEGTTKENNKIWGMVYLENVGNSKKFAGTLSALSKCGLYRKIDSDFGEVLLTD